MGDFLMGFDKMNGIRKSRDEQLEAPLVQTIGPSKTIHSSSIWAIIGIEDDRTILRKVSSRSHRRMDKVERTYRTLEKNLIAYRLTKFKGTAKTTAKRNCGWRIEFHGQLTSRSTVIGKAPGFSRIGMVKLASN